MCFKTLEPAAELTDVRDLALAHVRAMEKEAAIGKRFLVASDTGYLQAPSLVLRPFMCQVKMAEMLGDRFKAYGLPSESQETAVTIKPLGNKRHES